MPLVYTRAMTKDDLKKWRRRNSYSQTKLAKALGVAVMTVSRWETGLRSIPVFLNLALNWLEHEGGKAKGRKERKEVKRHG
jgi:transcriptional regulator with XRE-family HTH domain